MSVGHNEFNVTTSAEMTKLRGRNGSEPVMVAETTMVTIGSHANGLTGLKICTSGLIAALNVFDSPLSNPNGTAITVPIKKPSPTVFSEVKIWSTKVGAPEYSKFCTSASRPAAISAALRVSWAS